MSESAEWYKGKEKETWVLETGLVEERWILVWLWCSGKGLWGVVFEQRSEWSEGKEIPKKESKFVNSKEREIQAEGWVNPEVLHQIYIIINVGGK